MARRGVKKSTKRARKTRGARKVRARKSAGARKRAGTRKGSARRGARKTSARGSTRTQAARRKKTAPRRKMTAPLAAPATASHMGTTGGGGRDRDEVTMPGEDFSTSPDELDEAGGMSGMTDEDLER
jgi:hypothetical protein